MKYKIYVTLVSLVVNFLCIYGIVRFFTDQITAGGYVGIALFVLYMTLCFTLSTHLWKNDET